MAYLARTARCAFVGAQLTCMRTRGTSLPVTISPRLHRCFGFPSAVTAQHARRVWTDSGRARSSLPAAEGQQLPCRADRAVDNKYTGTLDLVWSSGEVTSFPYVWLRDSCMCSSCYHTSSLQRLFPIAALDPDVVPSAVENDSDGQRVLVTWSDGHVSDYSHDWLADHVFAKQQLERRRRRQRPVKSVLWDGKIGQQNLLRVDYRQLLDQLPVLHRALKQLQTYGIMVVTGSPTRFGVVEEICDRLGQTRTTHYGRTFRVSNKVGANNLAYTAEGLELHLDLPFYHHVPGIQALHCIAQHTGTGGDNILADSFYAADLIRRQRPDLYHLLTTLPVEFQDVGHEDDAHDCHFHKIQEHTMFKLNEDGDVFQVLFNNHARSYRLNVDLQYVKPMFEGMKMFHDLCMSEENHMLYKMDDGDVLVFNNVRVMHGRLGYTATKESQRVLEGAYSDWDEVICRYRVVSDFLRDGPTSR